MHWTQTSVHNAGADYFSACMCSSADARSKPIELELMAFRLPRNTRFAKVMLASLSIDTYGDLRLGRHLSSKGFNA